MFTGDSLTYHVGKKFSTKDYDNDDYTTGSCAQDFQAGWWYGDCYWSNLNGIYQLPTDDRTPAKGIDWFNGQHPMPNLAFVQMKVKRYFANA